MAAGVSVGVTLLWPSTRAAAALALRPAAGHAAAGCGDRRPALKVVVKRKPSVECRSSRRDGGRLLRSPTPVCRAATTSAATEQPPLDWSTFDSWTQVGECRVLAPPRRLLSAPRGVIHFLGGAFIGAIPEVTYRTVLEGLAADGYVVIANPFRLTFRHVDSCQEANDRFMATYNALCAQGFTTPRGTAVDIASLPVYGIGHSNGALLHLLIGAVCSNVNVQANVLISYNNKPAADAIPFVEQVLPSVGQLAPLINSMRPGQFAQDAVRQLGEIERQLALTGLTVSKTARDIVPVLNQIIPFLEEVLVPLKLVQAGQAEFYPPPAESLAMIEQQYKIPRTLLVQFLDDGLDETPKIVQAFSSRGIDYEIMMLGGSHLTPVSQEAKWQIGPVFTPVDAIAQALRSQSSREVKALQIEIRRWLRSL
eukprot:jgi/Chlat1/3086/Chrsp21S08796